jgi:hypothetical protein
MSGILSQVYVGLHIQCPLYLPGFHETFILLDRFSKNILVPNFMKIRPVGDELFHADRQTDRYDEARNRFLRADASKNGRSRGGK